MSLFEFRPRARLHVLPIAGAAVFVDLPGRRNDLMIDCSNEFDFIHVIRPFLRAQGVNRIANLALSHGDIQHIGAFAEFAREFQPGTVFTSPHQSRSPADKAARALLRADEKIWRTVAKGEALARWDVLHPAADRKLPRADDNALVLRTVIAGWRVLCLSDLGRDGLRALIRGGQQLEADILLVGASTANGRLSEDLVHRVSPRTIVFDPGRFNASDPPKASVPVLLPSEVGAISFEFTRGQCLIRCANGEEFTLAR